MGLLTVTKHNRQVRRPNGRTYREWLCKCRCRNKIWIAARYLGTTRVRKSCGCLKQPQLGKRKPGYAVYNAVFHNYRWNALKRNRPFTLTLPQFIKLVKMSCWYCGCKPNQVKSTSYETVRVHGVDRFVNDKGYVPGNVVPCCWECNRLKGDRDGCMFLSRILKIVKHRNLSV